MATKTNNLKKWKYVRTANCFIYTQHFCSPVW